MIKKPGLHFEDILTDQFQEDNLMEVPLSEGIFKWFLTAVIVLVGFAIVRLWDIGVLENSFYKKRAEANMSFTEVSRPPRGLILDRFGKPLVENKPLVVAYLIPHELPRRLDERLQALARISEILGLSESEIEAKIKEKNWSFSEKMELKRGLDYNEISAIESEGVAGLAAETVFQRTSVPAGVFSPVTGFTGLVGEDDLKVNLDLSIDDEIGKSGLEAYYDRYLRGKNGRTVVLRDALGNVKEKTEVAPAEPGQDLQTFIDKDFQEYFYNRLAEALQELGRESGAGLAINPQNGEVLALVSIPSFDVGDVTSYLTKPNQPLFNRVISGLYNPGSTIKPLDAIAALVEKIIDPTKQIYSAGFIEVPNPYNPGSPSRFLDWRPHGLVDLRAALARSSNVYFYEVGGGFPAGGRPVFGGENQVGLGIEKLRAWWQNFNLDQKTRIDLPGEKAGFLPSVSWKENKFGEPWRLGDTYNVAIGQGDLLVTPAELLTYIAAVGNGGKIYKLRVADNNPEILKDLSPQIGAVLKDVQEGMRDAVEKSYGTAHLLADLPLSVAAKTGTAQIQNNEKVNAFFVGYAPADVPQIAVLVLVENAREGSLNAVPVAKDVLLWYYNHRIKSQAPSIK